MQHFIAHLVRMNGLKAPERFRVRVARVVLSAFKSRAGPDAWLMQHWLAQIATCGGRRVKGGTVEGNSL